MKRSNQKPAPYPLTDATERRAVHIFEGAIDFDRVKPDIKTCDKVPNIDGTLELTDIDGTPIGNFSVQVKTLPSGQMKYSCPIDLFFYSERSPQPLLLVCVDIDSKSVYWKHIHPLMDGAKPQQKSFTIHFSDNDLVSPDSSYLARWEAIAKQYILRITEYPLLKDKIEKKLLLPDISKNDLEYFQRYISEINNLLDNDFVSAKTLLMADVWKLGVAITKISDKEMSYFLYKIAFGSSDTIICKADAETFDLSQMKGSPFEKNHLSYHWSSRQRADSPENEALRFVLAEVDKIAKSRRFPIAGEALAKDVIFSFMKRYAHTFGLEHAAKYSLSDLSNGMFQVLPNFCSAVADGIGSKPLNFSSVLDFDNISNAMRRNPKINGNHSHRNNWILRSFSQNLNTIRDAIEYLLGKNRPEIINELCPPTNPNSRGWVWSYYTPDEQTANAEYLLKNAIPAYERFVKKNRLNFRDSPYLNTNMTVIFMFAAAIGKNSRGPVIGEFHIKNSRYELPKFIVQTKDDVTSLQSAMTNDITLLGKKYTPEFSSFGDASYLFKNTPLLNLVYKLLGRDFTTHYGLTRHPYELDT